MALATFAVVIHRYKPSAFVVAEYEVYQNLAEYVIIFSFSNGRKKKEGKNAQHVFSFHSSTLY